MGTRAIEGEVAQVAQELWLGMSESERARLGEMLRDPEVGKAKPDPRGVDLMPLMAYQEYDVLLPGGKIRRVTGDRIRPVGGVLLSPLKSQD